MDVFCFGSNQAGRHGAGAALHAAQHHGAIRGRGEGPQGRSYAIPTKDAQLRVLSLSAIEVGVQRFLRFATARPQHRFNLTAIGCGLGGYAPSQIAPLFAGAPRNVVLPDEFRAVLHADHVAEPITVFRGAYDWLSNFYPATVHHREWVYPSVEHGYQATKTVVPSERDIIGTCRGAARARWLGKHYATLRPGWDTKCDAVMLHFVRDKFTRHAHLRERLCLTGGAQISHVNGWGDVYWGVCGGKGQDKLGHILMRVRDELR